MRRDIVLVDGSLSVTGGLKCAVRMARLLDPWARFTLVLPRESRIPGPELEAFDEVVRLPVTQLRRAPWAIFTYIPALLTSSIQLVALLRRKKAAALVINDFFLLHGWAARTLGFPGRILTWVRFDPQRFPGFLSRTWLAAAERASDEIIAVSQFARSRIPASVGAQVIYDTIDPALPVGRVAGKVRSDIVCVGNYIRGKGQDHAIDAFRLIADRFPETRLVFHGGDMGLVKNRAFRNELERRAKDCRLQDRIVFGDYAGELAAVFATAAVALNLSESETFSLTCLEASQCGVAVIAFRSGGPAEIIEDGVTGVLCELGNTTQVAEAMSTLLADPARATAMGEAAAEHVAKKFGTESYVRQLRALLKLEEAEWRVT